MITKDAQCEKPVECVTRGPSLLKCRVIKRVLKSRVIKRVLKSRVNKSVLNNRVIKRVLCQTTLTFRQP